MLSFYLLQLAPPTLRAFAAPTSSSAFSHFVEPDHHHGHSHSHDGHGHSHDHDHDDHDEHHHESEHHDDHHGHSHHRKEDQHHGHSHERGYDEHGHGDDDSGPRLEGDSDAALLDWTLLGRVVGADAAAQRVLAFTLVMGAFSLLSIVMAFRSLSHSLLGASFYSAFTACQLALALLAQVLMKRSATARYSYGFERLEVIGVFTVASLMLFVALFMLKEAVELLFEEEHSPAAFTMFNMALLGLALHTLCALLFGRHLRLSADSVLGDSPSSSPLAAALWQASQHGDLVASVLYACSIVPCPSRTDSSRLVDDRLLLVSFFVGWLPSLDAVGAVLIAALMFTKALPALVRHFPCVSAWFRPSLILLSL